MSKKFSSLIPFLEERSEVIANVLIVLTLLLGIAYSLYLGNAIHYYDETEYQEIARNISDHGTVAFNDLEPTAWRPPGYPFILAIFMHLGANTIFLRIVNFIALAISMKLLYSILRPQSGLAALLGIILILAYPVVFYTASTIYPQTIATTLLLLSILLFYKSKTITTWASIVIGIAQGILILMIPTFIFSLIFLCAWTFLRKIPHRLKTSLLIFVVALLVITPWTIRNYIVFDAFVPVSTNSGINFLLGNSPHTEPNLGVNIDLSEYRAGNSFKNEVEADNYYRDQAFEYIKNNKWKSFKLYIEKFFNYFTTSNVLATASEGSAVRTLVLTLSYGLLLALAIVRLIYTYKSPLTKFEWFLLLFYVLNGASMALFFTRIRFRLPFDFILILFGAPFAAFLLYNFVIGNRTDQKEG